MSVRTEIGALGVWTWLDNLPATEAGEFAKRIEDWGYSALWVPEAVGRDPFVVLAHLATQTQKLVLATGIANIYARDPMTMRAAQLTLGEMAPGRIVLGLGVSHAHLVQKVRGHEYKAPVPAMREYLEAMEQALFAGLRPEEEPPILIGALREKMLRLSGKVARGAHPYFVSPEHTKFARGVIGPDAWLCPEQKVLLETDATRARTVARDAMKVYLGLPNYQNNLRNFGWGDADFEDGGSDGLVDSIVAWGDADALRERIAAHRDAGADHVCIQPLRADGGPGPDLETLEALAPVNAG